MSQPNFEALGTHLETWVNAAPSPADVGPVTRDAQTALVEAGMVQYNPDGWDFKLHEKHPDAPRAQFKLMIRQAPGVDTNPDYYKRFVRPAVLKADLVYDLAGVERVLGYPNAGRPIAKAFCELALEELGLSLVQLDQDKVTHPDGTRELGAIIPPFEPGEVTLAIDDTATGGDTKIEGWEKITEQGLSYAGLVLLVERDPLGTALVRQRTEAEVLTSMHWLTVVEQAAKVLDLPNDAVQRERDYSLQLFEWNVANNNLGSLPDPDRL